MTRLPAHRLDAAGRILSAWPLGAHVSDVDVPQMTGWP